MYDGSMNIQRGNGKRGIVPSILAETMRQRNISAAALARATGISSATISLILSGKRHATSAVNTSKFAEVLGVSVDYLMGLSETPEPTPLMLGELLVELTQVARKLPPRRQRDLLAIAQTYLEMSKPRDRKQMMDEVLDLIEEYGGSVSRERLLDLLGRPNGGLLDGDGEKPPQRNN